MCRNAFGIISFFAVIICTCSSETIDCTPESQQEVRCEYSSTKDCPNIIHNESATPLQPVENITIQRYFSNVVNYTGVRITWSSPTSTALRETAGYALSLFAMKSDGNKELILCQYFSIFLVGEVTEDAASNYRFSYLKQSIPWYSTQILVELITIPAQPMAYTPSISVSQFTSYGNPVNHFCINGSKAEWSLPYTATVLIKQPGYDPDAAPLYNFTKYRILVTMPDSSLAYDIDDSIVHPIDVILNGSTEYVERTFSKLVPTQYRIEVRPYIIDTKCLGSHCQDDVDLHQISHFFISVSGYEYRPNQRPMLDVSKDKVEVSFEVAPTHLYISSYEISLSEAVKGVLYKELVEPELQANWYIYTHHISVTHLDFTKKLEVKVLPVVHSALCTRPGLCNLNGTCISCQESVSYIIQTSSTTTEEKKEFPIVKVWHIVVAVCGTAIVVTAISTSIYVNKRPLRQVEDNNLSVIPQEKIAQYNPTPSSIDAVLT